MFGRQTPDKTPSSSFLPRTPPSSSSAAKPLLPLAPRRWDRHQKVLPFAAVCVRGSRQAFDIAPAAESVAKTLAGTSVFTVSNANNEFMLISDPASVKSLGMLCFRQEDAEALLAQAFGFQVDNGIPIIGWYSDRSERALLDLLPFLDSLAGVEGVRPVIAKQFNLREKVASAVDLYSNI